MRAVVLVILLAGCGRFNFDPQDEADAAPVIDAPSFPDLALFLPFNNTFDDVGRMHTGACEPSCPQFRTGHANLGTFYSDTSCLRFDNVAAFNTPTFTLAVWVDPAATAMGGSWLAKPYDAATGSANSWQLAGDGTSFALRMRENGANVQLAAPVGAAAWHHVAATFDGTTKRLFIDGVERASAPGVTPVYTSDAIRVGCDRDAGAPTLYARGTIDVVEVFTRALSAAEVAALAAM